MTQPRPPGGPFEHRIRCLGGPFDGRGFTLQTEHRLPWRIVEVADPDGQLPPAKYLRLQPLRPRQPGEPWEYVPLPAGQGASPRE